MILMFSLSLFLWLTAWCYRTTTPWWPAPRWRRTAATRTSALIRSMAGRRWAEDVAQSMWGQVTSVRLWICLWPWWRCRFWYCAPCSWRRICMTCTTAPSLAGWSLPSGSACWSLVWSYAAMWHIAWASAFGPGPSTRRAIVPAMAHCIT